MKKLILIRLSLLTALAVVLTTCAVNPVTGKRQMMLISEEQEMQMGKEYDPQIIAQFGEYKNDAMLAFINQRAAEIAKISHRPNIEWHVRILDSPVVNAFAVPGGYVYFTRGILTHFSDEAELVGVLGHEMGHVTARHSVSQQSKQQLSQLLLVGGMIASPKFAQYGQEAMQAMQLMFLKFSRDDEREADRLGVQYMSLIDYDGNRMAEFFNVLNKMNPPDEQGGVPTFLSTHPNPGDRNTTVRKLTEFWKDSLHRTEWKVNSDSYLKMIDGMVYGEDPRQGYTEGNVFYHPGLKFKFTYPSGWQFQNSPAQVATAPKDGKALIIFTLAQQKSLEEAAQATMKQYSLTASDSKSIKVNGLPALAVLSQQVQQDQSTGQQQANQILSYFIDYGGNIYVFHGVSTIQDFKSYQPAIESTLSSFAPLNDPAKLNVKPKKIIVKPATNGGQVSQVLAGMGVPQDQLKEVALLNDMELKDNIPAGKLVKIIGE
ncbi:MAG: M48 family metalloprotease [Chloroflexota bacterium]